LAWPRFGLGLMELYLSCRMVNVVFVMMVRMQLNLGYIAVSFFVEFSFPCNTPSDFFEATENTVVSTVYRRFWDFVRDS
jgi:hypothetical protein